MSALVVMTLAIGIAATTIAFSVADAVLWHPLPFADADRLVRVRASVPRGVNSALEAWPARDQLFDDLYPFGLDSGIVDAGGEPQAVTVGLLSPGLLGAIGASPTSGRPFGVADAQPGSSVIIISADLARRIEAGSGTATGAIGQTVRLDGVPQTIVGVMPGGFDFPVGRVALWRPYVSSATATRMMALGKLKRGVTMEAAQAFIRADASSQDSGSQLVRNVQVTLFVQVNPATSLALRLLFGAAALVLLIAVANAANLLLAEAVRRDAELAIRVSLGASWPRLARQMATEAILVSAIAVCAALIMSAWALGALVKTIPYLISFQALRPIALDWRALSFAAIAAMLASLGASGLLIFRARRIDAQVALRGQTSGIPGQAHTRNALTVAQLAVTLALLACAGLLANGLLHLGRVDPGFNPDGLVDVVVQMPTWRFANDVPAQAALERVRAEAARLPGVVSATISHKMPPGLDSRSLDGVEIADAANPSRSGVVALGLVDDAFFSTLGIPVLAGRGIDSRDRQGSQPVAVVSRAFAELLSPDGDAIGRRFRESKDAPWLTVVGVVGNVANAGVELASTPLAFYASRLQTTARSSEGLIVRTRTVPEQVVPDLRAAFRRVMPDAPIIEVTTAEEAIGNSNARVRFATGLMMAFAGVALALALIGVYATFWYTVRQRTREIGVRLALGAAPADILRMVLGLGARLTLVGLIVGLPLALLATRSLRSLLFGVSSSDPATFAVVAIVLAVAAIAATYLPARRASHVDPVDVLRHV